mmetsp:Transcript_5547/g.6395  ORF Transcript_5547/g.6395 Transcript_5547/m.6395 type:complete len:80 (+) Transcript_5547:112-351(+)
MAVLIPDDEDLIVDDDGIEAVQSQEIIQNLESSNGFSWNWKEINIVFLLLSLLFLLSVLNVFAWRYNKKSIARFYKYKL